MPDFAQSIQSALAERFGERFEIDASFSGLEELARIAAHRVHRRYLARDIAPELLRLLCACALSAPSKSDLQQSDILIIREKAKRHAIADLLPEMPWLRDAPVFLVFLANGRRLPRIAEMRGKPFPNDHFDLVFNATVDAALVLATFLRAAEAAGLGCCPISVIRDHASTISDMLALPEKIIPVAGMSVGWPAEEGGITPRLPLSVTLHEERFTENDFAAAIDGYDRRRAALRPYRHQRQPERFGRAEFYGWSEDKARQYANPARADFGAFVRTKGVLFGLRLLLSSRPSARRAREPQARRAPSPRWGEGWGEGVPRFSISHNPSPAALRASTSPYGRGEVRSRRGSGTTGAVAKNLSPLSKPRLSSACLVRLKGVISSDVLMKRARCGARQWRREWSAGRRSGPIARTARAFARRAVGPLRLGSPKGAVAQRPGATASRVYPTCVLIMPISGKPEIGCAPFPFSGKRKKGLSPRRRGATAYPAPQRIRAMTCVCLKIAPQRRRDQPRNGVAPVVKFRHHRGKGRQGRA